MTTEAKHDTEAEANPEAGSGRSAARIESILQIISDIWHSEPDLRLCQILSNAGYYSGRDLFYLEDDALYESLKEFKAFQQGETEEMDNGKS